MRRKLQFSTKNCGGPTQTPLEAMESMGHTLENRYPAQASNSYTQQLDCVNFWSSEFVPKEESELVIAGDRITAIKEWLEEQKSGQDVFGNPVSRLLFVQGPTGSSKSCSVRVLGREAGFQVWEWTDNTPDDYDVTVWLDIQRRTNLDRLEQFIQKSTRNLLFSQKSKAQPRLIFISELPFAWLRESQQRLINLLTQLVLHSNCPIIIKITIYYCDNNELGYKFQSGDVRDQIIQQLLQSRYPEPKIIKLNQIKECQITKVLKRILEVKGMQNFVGDDIKEIVQRSDRDLRYAINALQMYVNDPTIYQESIGKYQNNKKRKKGGKENNKQPRKKSKQATQSSDSVEFLTQETTNSQSYFQISSQQQQQQDYNLERPISKLIKPHDKGENLMLGLGKIVHQKEDAWKDLDGLLSKMDTSTATLVSWLEEKMFERFGVSQYDLDDDDEFRWEKFDESVQIINYFVDALKISSGAFNLRGSREVFADGNSKQIVLCERVGSAVASLGFMSGLKHVGKDKFQPNRRPKILDMEKSKSRTKQQVDEFRILYCEMTGELVSIEDIVAVGLLQQEQQLQQLQQQKQQKKWDVNIDEIDEDF